MNPETNNMSEQQQKQFETILSWDIDRIKLYCKNKLGYTDAEYLNSMAIEYKKFIFLISNHHDTVIPISDKVDDMWHSHILSVRAYTEFCGGVFGRVLYHNPTVSEDENRDLQGDYKDNTLRLYEHYFGEPNEFWSTATGSDPCCTH